MTTQHEEFPKLIPEARAAAVISLGYSKDRVDSVEVTRKYRCQLAAFLREAMKQAKGGFPKCPIERSIVCKLITIANNLHSPPPPPPILADAREADLSTPEGRIMVATFLAKLATETQP